MDSSMRNFLARVSQKETSLRILAGLICLPLLAQDAGKVDKEAQ